MSIQGDGVAMSLDPTSLSVPILMAYEGSDTLSEGMAVAIDRVNATAAKRKITATKVTLSNAGDFFGIVAPGQLVVGDGTLKYVSVVPWDGRILRGASVYTDESVVAGDFLAPIPNTYAFGKCVVGNPVFKCSEAQDRSTTAGLVLGDFGPQFFNHPDLSAKRVSFFDDFVGLTTIASVVANAVADQTTYLLTGTTATASYKDSMGPEAAVGLQAKGVLRLTPTTTTQANITLNGEPFRLDAGRSAFFRARLSINDVTTGTTGVFIGLSITDTAFIASKPSDYIGFLVVNAALEFEYRKASGTAITSASLATLVADTNVEVAFLIRNRGAGGMSLSVWVDGVLVISTVTTAQVPSAESLTFVAETKGAEAHILDIDRVEIENYAKTGEA